MITRNTLIDCADTICKDSSRLELETLQELQAQYNVNSCEDCDSWLDSEPVDNGLVTIISDEEFFERYVF